MIHWSLDPNVIHLNHGSFGACPVSVLEAQQRWRSALERNPVRFMTATLPAALEQSRMELAAFVGANPSGVVFVPNATVGINSVLRSIEKSLAGRANIVISDHTYNASRNAAEASALRTGSTLVETAVPFPLLSPREIVDKLLNAVTTHTRLVIVDLVTSPTALVVPVAELIRELEPEIPVLVDAAHGPGMVPLDLESLGASFVVGNCHKWMCAPKGAGFLYVRRDRRDLMTPAIVSHGWNTPSPGGSRFHDLFDWAGTDDPSARLAVPAAIETMGAMSPAGWSGVMADNRVLAIQGRNILCDALGISAPAPDSAIGSMATIELPGPRRGKRGADPLTEVLRARWSIEVPVFSWRDWPHRLLRISAQRYNHPAEYEKLAAALRSELRGSASSVATH